jgi:hypothetical protein
MKFNKDLMESRFENLPQPNEFYNKGMNALMESFFDASQIYSQCTNNDHIQIEKVKLEKSHNNLHHASELLIKDLICQKSPFFLLKTENLEKHEDKKMDFSKINTINASKLINTTKSLYNENIFKNNINSNFEYIYKNLTEIRNKNMHSTGEIINLEDDKHTALFFKEYVNQFITIFMTFSKRKNIRYALFYKIKEQYNNLEILNSNMTKKERKEEHELLNIDSNITFEPEIFNSVNNNISFIYTNLKQAHIKKIFNLNDYFKKNKSLICPNCLYLYIHNISSSNIDRIYQEKRNFSQHHKLLCRTNESEYECLSCQIKYKHTEAYICKQHCENTKKQIHNNQLCLNCGMFDQYDYNPYQQYDQYEQHDHNPYGQCGQYEPKTNNITIIDYFGLHTSYFDDLLNEMKKTPKDEI